MGWEEMKKIKKIVCFAMCILLCIVSMSANVFAHSGRTDSSGGHNDEIEVKMPPQMIAIPSGVVLIGAGIIMKKRNKKKKEEMVVEEEK